MPKHLFRPFCVIADSWRLESRSIFLPKWRRVPWVMTSSIIPFLLVLNIWRRGELTALHLCHWLNNMWINIFLILVFFFLGSTSAALFPPREEEGGTEGRVLISWTAASNRAYFLCWLTTIASNTFIENKTCGFKVFRSKTPNYLSAVSFSSAAREDILSWLQELYPLLPAVTW